MTAVKFSLSLIFVFLLAPVLNAQVKLPGFTGYALPAEESTEEGESRLFSDKQGLHNWTSTKQKLQYFFYTGSSGSLSISLWAKNSVPGTLLQVRIANKKLVAGIPAGNAFKKIKMGTVAGIRPGFYCIEITALKKGGRAIAAIESVELEGSAAAAVQFNAKPRRNAASVHLKYPLADTAKAVSFYSELMVPEGADPLYTYYMADGFARGYFGMQVNSAAERRIIFSVWDAGNEAADRTKVPEEKKVKLLGKGVDVVADGFGNEGTGGHSHFVYNWKTGTAYKFLVTALPDSASRTTIYTGYFFIPEWQQWKLLASFRAPEDGHYLGHLYSFVENFDGVNGQLSRKAFFSNQWIRQESGQWNEITKASFSYDATGRARDRLDYGAGTEAGKFYLWNGGFRAANIQFGDTLLRNGSGTAPVIDLYRNADSALQAAADYRLMAEMIAGGKLDTTGSAGGVYYKLLKEGTGRQVRITDTVTVYYRGSLLNGEVFDQTKDKPATFPLPHLIKGWQTGLPMCRVGGKIQLVIPSHLAYGIRSRSSKIPVNSVLQFEIEVVDAK